MSSTKVRPWHHTRAYEYPPPPRDTRAVDPEYL